LQLIAYFYQVPLDEGKFDVCKESYKGELVDVGYIPDEVVAKEEGGERGATPSVDVVGILD